MNNERMIAVSSGLIERAVSLLDLLPESGTIIELRAALATQPAAGEQAPIGYANPKHLASMAAGTRAIVPVLPSICPGLHHTEPVYAAPPAAAHGDEAVRKDAERFDWLISNVCMGSVGFGDWWMNADEPASEWRAAIDAAMRAQAGKGES